MQWTGGQVYSLQSTVSNADRAFQAKLMVARHSSVRGLMACIPFRWFVDGDAPVELVMHELLEQTISLSCYVLRGMGMSVSDAG